MGLTACRRAARPESRVGQVGGACSMQHATGAGQHGGRAPQRGLAPTTAPCMRQEGLTTGHSGSGRASRGACRSAWEQPLPLQLLQGDSWGQGVLVRAWEVIHLIRHESPALHHESVVGVRRSTGRTPLGGR